MMYLDANFFVFAILDKTRKGERAREIQKSIVENKENAVTSVLALDEVMWVLLRNNKKHLLRKVIEDIYSTPNLQVREVSSLIPMQALDLIELHNLKPRDAFNLAVMEELEITKIVTDDSDFDKINKIIRIKLD